ncbi:hypothetical protein [Caulobacter sp. RL271]|jgi:hypothetical protein|uniref:Uncharacterized protein n=1 Tax=Caulobacter segnis TaxID=88688 RepID=A0ABY4ZQD4_9CAUL|nr:hypothetical protein [Caulobacter segnis]USQ95003.1 hypothetical protein MZV50_20945 [Caulobacter segnis]
MTARILIVGQDADTVDYAAPGIIAGMTAEKVRAGLAASKAALESQGHACDLLEVQPDPPTAEAEVRAQLAGATYDVVVIGAGIRNPPPKLFLFETVLNAVHAGAPSARIAFNTRPDDSDGAALRWAGR